ncbi:MAG: DUF4388 domain-containing protein [Deltaproteobacteria bacterium]|nr:DUF4388 domain-containing protein [Deltaproteobacteria bacterium]MBW2447739.1 DUF4388 domain-containing protein [Deltaproteobacteria bacterium]
MAHADAMDLFEAREAPVGRVTLSQSLREMMPFDVPRDLAVGPACEAGPAPVLALAADVRNVAIGDLLGMLQRAARSGLVLFGFRDHAKAIYVHRGEVVFAASNLAGDRIGESLVRSGRLSLEALRLAERSFAPGERFGKTLVELGHVTPRELWHGVKYQVEEIVRSLFSYTDGAVYFFAGEVKPDNVVRLSLPTERLVEEGIEQREGLRRFVALLHEPGVELVRTPDASENLEGSELLLYHALAGEVRFANLVANLDLDERSAARAVEMLRRLGALKLRRRTLETAVEPALDEEALRRSVNAHLKLIAELAAPIVAVEGAQGLRERFGSVLEEISHRYPALLAGVPMGPAATLDPGPVVVRALGLRGDRQEQVRAALGELVSYLEFELKNHADILDADAFLGPVEGLRREL